MGQHAFRHQAAGEQADVTLAQGLTEGSAGRVRLGRRQ